MSFINRARDLVQRALGPTSEEAALEEPAAPLPHRETERADEFLDGFAVGRDELGLGSSEFDDFLSGIGAEPLDLQADDELDRKDREIAELQRNLAMLRPIGDELAATERRRLALVEEVDQLKERLAALEGPAPDPDRALLPAEVRALARLAGDLEGVLARAAAPAEPPAEEAEEPTKVKNPQRELKKLRELLAKREAAKARAEERLAMWRERGEEMKAKAAERWFELRDLQSRATALEKEVRARRRTLRLLLRPVHELRKRFPDRPEPLDRILEVLGIRSDDSGPSGSQPA